MKKILILFALIFVFSSANTANALTLDCMFCHSSPMGFGGKYPPINISMFGSHLNINSSDGTGNLTSSDCITCHYSANISSFHALPVSTYTCEDCHIKGAAPGAPRVNNHIKNSNISVNAFCSDCHNKTATLFLYNNNASAAHYGRNASFGLSPGDNYCAFCHSNSTTIYKDVMQNQNNNQLKKHTPGSMYPLHPAGQLGCTTCHDTDINLHGPNISKPVLNSDFCLNCHINDRLQKNRHNNKVECLFCHTEVQSDIHSIKYIMQDGTYRGINATNCYNCHNFSLLPPPSFQLPFPAADCTTCHQNGGLTRFNLAPQIPTPLKHSTNPNSGNMWNGSAPAYWNNTSQTSACKYCHGNTLHSSDAMGNIRNIQSGNIVNQSITNTSYWCSNCHYMNTSSGNYSYNGSSYSPIPPEIQNQTGLVPQNAQDGTNFFNHSIGNWSDIVCKTCHSNNSVNSTTQFIHNVTSGGGGSDCRSCHDIFGFGAPLNKKVDISDFNKSVHNRLNGGGNRACWACHGDGTEPGGHPPQYKSPRKCGDDNCHSLSQSYRAPMVYSHFKNASLNNNNENALNFNVTVSNNCEDCHIQSVIYKGNSKKSTVSHYGILASLPDTRNCIYCHLNKDNSEKWGNATRININRTSFVELDRINNKFTVKAGESVGLGSKFKLKVDEISTDRIALIELLKDDVQVDRSAVSLGNYTYEETLIIENSSLKVPVIVLNFTGFFYSENISFVQFEGFRTKRVHSENKSTFCYQCHYYSRPQIKYRVIERVASSYMDAIYYTEELVNFSDQKQYDENDALRIIMNLTDTDFNIDINPVKRKPMLVGEAWNISQDYTVKVDDITKESDEAFIQLNIGNYSYEDIVKKGEYFEYRPKINYLGYKSENITIFRAKVSDIVHGISSNLVVMENVLALSMDIKKIEANQTLDGYNASWLWENSTITAGKIPSDFHSPSLFDGKDGGGNCLTCHGIEGFVEKRVIGLGKHTELNGGGNQACYACHGGSAGIQSHPSGFKSPRKCISCHASTVDNYSAIYIGDEEHKDGVCENCHVTNKHSIQRFGVTPSVKEISLITQDNKTIIKAFASAGYKMRIRGARYYIDSPQVKFMMSPEDGIFDTQKEEIVAQINVSKISAGKHVIYVEAMERNNEWGVASSIAVNVDREEINLMAKETPGFSILFGGMAIILLSLSKIYRKKV